MFACLLALCSLNLFAQTKSIYNNLGNPAAYLQEGWEIWGPNSGIGGFVFRAMAFTPKQDSHVSQVQVAIQYFGTGANQIDLSIYTDSGNDYPETLIGGPVTVANLPGGGTCCGLAVANFTPIAVTGGTRYWVVADTPLAGTGSDFFGGWRSIVNPYIPAATNKGSGWYQYNAEVLPAGEVLGTIP
jgi:hypothetical protein